MISPAKLFSHVDPMSNSVKAKTFSLKTSYVLYGTPAKVFEALTQEGIIGQWCDGGGKVEPKVDGDVELFGGWVIHKEGFRAPKIQDVARLQAWSLKPALPRQGGD